MTARIIRLKVKGKDETVDAATVAGLLAALKIDATRRGLAVAVDGELVPRRGWAEAHLTEGAAVEIVRPLQGG